MEGLPEAEAGLGVGALEIPGGQRAVSSPKRLQRLGVNLLLWRDKGSTSHRGPTCDPTLLQAHRVMSMEEMTR